VGGAKAPATIASHATNPSKEPTNPAVRAKYIKEQIEKYKEWGGHSMVPSRAINSNTFENVRQKIGTGDSAALMILLQDNAYDIRSIAAILLKCIDPNAESEIEKQIDMESSMERKNRFRDALIDIRTSSASCK
jgi:mevalonate kinase